MALKPRDFTLQEAATVLGISRIALVRQLDQLGAIEHDGEFGIRPRPGFAEQLRVETRTTHINGSWTKHYHHTTVTVQGLAWIERELRHAMPRAS